MKPRFRDSHGKAIKWRDTPTGKRKIAYCRLIAYATLSHIHAQIGLLRDAPVESTASRFLKTAKIAKAAIDGMRALNDALNGAKA